jgi:hypothetical protein
VPVVGGAVEGVQHVVPLRCGERHHEAKLPALVQAALLDDPVLASDHVHRLAVGRGGDQEAALPPHARPVLRALGRAPAGELQPPRIVVVRRGHADSFDGVRVASLLVCMGGVLLLLRVVRV